MKHRNKIITLILSLLAILSLASCGGKEGGIDFDTEGLTTVTYKINSGKNGSTLISDITYGNSTKDVVYYYDLKDGKTTKIYDIDDFSSIRNLKYPSGLELEGWYLDDALTKKWDFDSNVLSDGNNIELYPKWNNIIKYYYNVGYQKDGKFTLIYQYEANIGEKFSDYLSKITSEANKVNISWLGSFYSDPDLKTPWDNNYKMTEEKTEVYVYIDYIEGEYSIVRTYDDLKKAALSNSNIYLMNDIDCEGKELSFKNYSGSTRRRRSFIGNGHTISNFKLGIDVSNNGINTYDNTYFDKEDTQKETLGISLFGYSEYTDFSDVKFDNFNFEVKSDNSNISYCVISPFAYCLVNSKLANVTMTNCKITFTRLKVVDSNGKINYTKSLENNSSIKLCFNDFSLDKTDTTINNSNISGIEILTTN